MTIITFAMIMTEVIKMKKIDIALFIGLAAAIILGNFSVFAKDCEKVEKEVLRLHILANSDSDEDQNLKLEVRDEILKQTSNLLNTENLDNAEKTAKENLELITEIASKVVQKNGYDYNIKTEIVNMYFDTRYYDNITMPAGNYDAVRVTIGKGEGHNWWCVLYPPLCISGAVAEDYDEMKSFAYTSDKPQYTAKFKAVEIYKSVKNYINKVI